MKLKILNQANWPPNIEQYFICLSQIHKSYIDDASWNHITGFVSLNTFTLTNDSSIDHIYVFDSFLPLIAKRGIHNLPCILYCCYKNFLIEIISSYVSDILETITWEDSCLRISQVQCSLHCKCNLQLRLIPSSCFMLDISESNI
jgi:hypothetical protein